MFREDSIKLNSSSIVFQIVDWYQIDFNDEEEDDRSYIIKVFGVTAEGHSVSLNITDFQPYFFVTSTKRSSLTEHDLKILENNIVDKLPSSFKHDFVIDIVKRKTIWGFTNNEYHQYVKLSFKNLTCMYIVRKMLQSSMKLTNFTTKFKFHESNIEAFIRFIHNRDIKPGGWIEVIEFENDLDTLDTKCQINITTTCTNVYPYECTKIAPLVIMSVDIECTSSHGDFPVPIKTYRKNANEFIDYYNTLLTSTNKAENWYDVILDKLKECIKNMFFNGDILSKVYTKSKITEDDIKNIINENISDILDIVSGKSTTNKQFVEKYNIEPTKLNQLEIKFNNIFPELKGDPIIQIGSTVHRYGDKTCCYKNIITLDTCDDIDDVDVIRCKTEKQLIKEWCKLIHKIDPDIVTGYNILGFDFEYMFKRAQELECTANILQCGRLENHTSQYKEKMLASSALGENILKYFEMEGRVIIDLMKVVQREYKLDSYKLDNVASTFICGKITCIEDNVMKVDSSIGMNVGDFVKLSDEKYKVVKIKDEFITLDKSIDKKQTKWGLAKDDVTPQDIFNCQSGTSTDRATIAKYCVQDCALCNLLIMKLEVIANNLGMANVCLVPLSYIFMRGQGIKIFSLVAKQCKEDGFIIPLIKYDENQEDDNGYEGAIVLDPKPGIYVDAPISVMDYASLYPSSMISENISHDSIVLDEKYDNLEGVGYVDITYDLFSGIGDKKTKIGEKTCRYAQCPNNEKSILPRILMKLLSQRKSTRKQILYKTIVTVDNETISGLLTEKAESYEIKTSDGSIVAIKKANVININDTYDDFMKAILDGLQLAYKITANSLYGQVGARTSPIYMKELAASTTATGRNLILKAKQFMEDNYDADVIYGDTDSIFVDFRIKEKFGLTSKNALKKSIDIAIVASERFKQTLKQPHDLEYEKTFYPFIILSKKKYVGNLYEFDVNKFKQKSMGIVLKRRDNANILKIVYGGIIDILLNEHDICKAVQFLRESLTKLTSGEYNIQDLTITKTLRNTYKDPSRIAHKVLADRMKLRDPGSAPQTNDRIPYVYIEHDTKNKNVLQGDKIEHPSYILENNINIDYTFYITNQLMKPICQLLALGLFDIPKCKSSHKDYERKEKSLCLQYNNNFKKVKDKIADIKQLEVQKILFDDILQSLENKKNKNRTITEFFSIVPPH